jgi:hypothetical protein
MDRELDLEKFEGSYSKAELHDMNAAFIAAMGNAIRARHEHPPRVGIDPTPGTKNPVIFAGH